MNDYSHLRLHQFRTEEAERHHAMAVGTMTGRHTMLSRVLRALGSATRTGSPRTTVRYAGSGVTGERVE